MSAVFISYRRNDSSGHTGRIYDHLCSEFGKEFVFRDIDTIEPGTDFVEAVEQGIQECSVLIVVIGREWLTAEDEMGRRLDDPNDFVRIEIASSLKKGLHVIPVLVRGARMPSSKELPEDIAQLSRRLALEISDSRWDYDMKRLIETLSHFIRQDRQAEDADNRVAAADAARESDAGKTTSTIPQPPVVDSGVKNRRWLIIAIAIIFFASLVAIVFWQFRPQQEDADERAPIEKTPSQLQDSAVDEKRSRIEELLADAGNDIKASRLIAPAGNNAVAKYQEILDLEPENSSAQRGLDSIAEVLMHRTRSALESDDLENAEELLEQVKALNPASVDLDQLGVEIAQRKEQRVQQEKEEEARKAQQQEQEEEKRREEQRVQQEKEKEEGRKSQQQEQEEERRQEEQRVQQEKEEEERKAQQQEQEEERRREEQRVQQEKQKAERKALQQKQEEKRKREKRQSRIKREKIQSGKKRKTCLNRCANRHQSCLKKSRPAAGNCSSQARKKCKQAHLTCLYDPQNTMVMGVSGAESHCNGKFNRCVKLKTAQCSGSKGSSSATCETALSSCKKTCR